MMVVEMCVFVKWEEVTLIHDIIHILLHLHDDSIYDVETATMVYVHSIILFDTKSNFNLVSVII